MAITESEIEESLLRGSGFRDGKLRIYKHFKENTNTLINSKFLKNEYGEGGQNCAFGNNAYSYQHHNSKGIKLEKSNYKYEDKCEIFLTWDKVSQRIATLINQDRYLTNKEKVKYGIKQTDIKIVKGIKNVLDGQCSMF